MFKPVLLIRSENNEVDSAALETLGIPSVVDPYLEITATSDQKEGMRLFELMRSSMESLWVIATSKNSIRYWAQMVGEARFRAALQTRESLNFAAVGESTAETLRRYVSSEVFLPSRSDAATLAGELVRLEQRSRALIPGGNLALPTLPQILRDSGWSVDTAEVYRTSRVSAEPESASLLRQGKFSAVLLRSPSAVDALVHFVAEPLVPLVCAGPTTAAAVYAQGLQVAALSPQPTPEAVANTIHSLIFH